MPMVSRTHCLRLIATVHCSNLDVYFAAIAVGCMLDPNTRCWPVSSHCTHSRRYRSAVIDLFSRQVIGWSMGHRIDTELVINALLMALWRRHPKLLTPSTLIRAVSSLGMHGKTSCALTTWFAA